MTVIEIVKAYLTDNGYDGLYSEYGECACEISDLAPCCDAISSCHPGYRYICKDIDCEYTAYAGEHWHMREMK